MQHKGQKDTETLVEILNESRTSSKRASKATIISFIFVVISAIAAVSSAYFAKMDSIDDRDWKQEQIHLLQTLIKKVDTLNSNISNTNSVSQIEKANLTLQSISAQLKDISDANINKSSNK